MYEDEPHDKVHDVISTAVFGDHPLGRPVIGRGVVIAGLTPGDVASYHGQRYRPQSIVVAAAGNIEHERLEELGRSLMQVGGNGAAPDVRAHAPAGISPNVAFHAKETEQYHICLGGPGIARNDDRRFALAILDAILGGSTSSRLFQEIREKRGLAYAVYSWSSQYTDTGQVGIYVGTREDNIANALEVIGVELERICAEDIGEDELSRAREHVKGRLALSMESTASRMTRLGRSLLMDTPLLTLEETIERLDAVDSGQLLELARLLFPPTRLSAAAIGRDEGRFREALEPVGVAA
jgi:predicted Zn-dependent peptidase